MQIKALLLIFYGWVCVLCIQTGVIGWEQNGEGMFQEMFPLRKQIQIIDPHPDNAQMSGKSGMYHEFDMYKTHEDESDELMFGMSNLTKEFMAENQNLINVDRIDTFSQIKDLTLKDAAIYTMEIESKFSKLEVNLIQNDCLNLFIYLDEIPIADLQLNSKKLLVKIKFDKTKKNNLESQVDALTRKIEDSMRVIENNLESDQEFVYIKLFCPFYSSYSEKQVKFHVQKIPDEFELFKDLVDLNDSAKTLQNFNFKILHNEMENYQINDSVHNQKIEIFGDGSDHNVSMFELTYSELVTRVKSNLALNFSVITQNADQTSSYDIIFSEKDVIDLQLDPFDEDSQKKFLLVYKTSEVERILQETGEKFIIEIIYEHSEPISPLDEQTESVMVSSPDNSSAQNNDDGQNKELVNTQDQSISTSSPETDTPIDPIKDQSEALLEHPPIIDQTKDTLIKPNNTPQQETKSKKKNYIEIIIICVLCCIIITLITCVWRRQQVNSKLKSVNPKNNSTIKKVIEKKK